MAVNLEKIIDDLRKLSAHESQINSKEVKSLLHSMYGVLWTEVHYDPYNEETRKFASGLLPKIQRLNELLKFYA